LWLAWILNLLSFSSSEGFGRVKRLSLLLRNCLRLLALAGPPSLLGVLNVRRSLLGIWLTLVGETTKLSRHFLGLTCTIEFTPFYRQATSSTSIPPKGSFIGEGS